MNPARFRSTHTTDSRTNTLTWRWRHGGGGRSRRWWWGREEGRGNDKEQNCFRKLECSAGSTRTEMKWQTLDGDSRWSATRYRESHCSSNGRECSHIEERSSGDFWNVRWFALETGFIVIFKEASLPIVCSIGGREGRRLTSDGQLCGTGSNAFINCSYQQYSWLCDTESLFIVWISDVSSEVERQ